jgi:hypothetical protein
MHALDRLPLTDTVQHQRRADQTKYYDDSEKQPEPSSALWVVSEHRRLPHTPRKVPYRATHTT